jgi:ABC-2 type transport system ATP-binding protein
MTATVSRQPAPGPAGPTGPTGPNPDVPAIAVTGLVYAFGQTRAVDGIDLTVPAGDVFGLLGPNGAGKTTAIRAMTTLLKVPPGMISVFGRDVARDRRGVRRLLDFAVLAGAAVAGIAAASALLGRLAK